MATLLVTGGAGFIGSCYVLARCGVGDTVINLDKLTYSDNPENFASLSGNPRHIFVHSDIGNAELVEHLLKTYSQTPWSTLPPKAMWTVRLSIRKPLCVPTSLERVRFCAPPKFGGTNWMLTKEPPFASSISPRTRYSERCNPAIRPLRKQRRIAPTVLIPLQKLPVTILSGLSTKPTAFPRSSPIVRITMARASFLKNLFRWLRSMHWPARRSPYMEPAPTSVTGSM